VNLLRLEATHELSTNQPKPSTGHLEAIHESPHDLLTERLLSRLGSYRRQVAQHGTEHRLQRHLLAFPDAVYGRYEPLKRKWFWYRPSRTHLNDIGHCQLLPGLHISHSFYSLPARHLDCDGMSDTVACKMAHVPAFSAFFAAFTPLEDC
jgi:hypothetical protein